jgi:hypothetical protein
MISSPSAQIVNAVAEKTFISGPSGTPVEAYGPTMGVCTAIIATGIMVTAAFGPEKRGRRFETAVVGIQEELKTKTVEDPEKGDCEPADENIERASKN